MATIQRENVGQLTDKITITVSKEDYLGSFEKSLKAYSKQANIPGFRKGMVPAGIIKKMYGSSVFTEEVLRTVEKELIGYLEQEKLDIFAQPLAVESEQPQLDFNQPATYSFGFEIGLKPNFEVAGTSAAPVTRQVVTITEEMINEEVERLQIRNGQMSEPETVTVEDNVVNVTFTETDANGTVVEGGISKDNSLLVKYFAPAFRPQLMDKKAGDTLSLQLNQAFESKELDWVAGDLGLNKDNAADLAKYFQVAITKVGLVTRAALDETFFATVYPNADLKTEADFRAKVSEEMANFWAGQSRNMVHDQLFHYWVDNTTMTFPEAFLKRWLQFGRDEKKTAEEAEAEYPTFINQLKWTLISDKLVKDNQLSVEAEDLKAFAKQQVLGYMGMGMGADAPWLDEYVNKMMSDRKFVEQSYQQVLTEKLFTWAEGQVNATEQAISVEEFVKQRDAHQHHHH